MSPSFLWKLKLGLRCGADFAFPNGRQRVSESPRQWRQRHCFVILSGGKLLQRLDSQHFELEKEPIIICVKLFSQGRIGLDDGR